MKRVLRRAAAIAAMLVWLAAGPARAQPVTMYYGAELVSDYVVRGDDRYVRAFTRDGEEHKSVNAEPALRPQLILFGPSVTFNITGTFALRDRKDEPDHPKGAFYGFERDDEIDLELTYHWSNRLGRIGAGLIYYSYLDPAPLGPYGAATLDPSPEPLPTEMVLRWAFPFATSVNPELAYYATNVPGVWYSSLGLHGGVSSLAWTLRAGFVRTGRKDLTGGLSFGLGSFTLGLHAAYRPDPKNLLYSDVNAGERGYDVDGRYTPDPEQPQQPADYPPTIYWISLGWGQRVR